MLLYLGTVETAGEVGWLHFLLGFFCVCVFWICGGFCFFFGFFFLCVGFCLIFFHGVVFFFLLVCFEKGGLPLRVVILKVCFVQEDYFAFKLKVRFFPKK